MASASYMLKVVKQLIPSPLKLIYKKVIYRYKYGFYPLRYCYDLSGYETLLDFLKVSKIYLLEGDVVEIGAFLGAGTYKLCKFYEKYSPSKKVYAADVFDPRCDLTESASGLRMCDLYERYLKGEKQLDVFRKTTIDCKNLQLIIGDSKNMQIPCEKINFAFIDGNHSSDYVLNDFYKVWEKVVPGGVVAFDDYGFDLPEVTRTIHGIIHKELSIKRIYTSAIKIIFIIKS